MGRMPQVTARDLIRFLKAQGFEEDRQAGSGGSARAAEVDELGLSQGLDIR